MPGWGGMPWGLGPWGGFGGATYISNAYAVSTNTVRVIVAGNPQVISEWTPGDALNPACWTVELTAGGKTWTVIQVEQRQAAAGALPAVFDLFVLEVLESALVEHMVAASGVVDLGGFPINSAFAFPGVIDEAVLPEKEAAARNLAVRDLANPPFISEEYTGGTLRITAAGDYQNEEGTALVRKMIWRRLTTFKGAFFHLPEFGLALSPKSLLTTSDLIKLKGEVERQAMREPEVEAVKASITLSSTGALTVELRVRVRPSGQDVAMSIQLPVAAIAL